MQDLMASVPVCKGRRARQLQRRSTRPGPSDIKAQPADQRAREAARGAPAPAHDTQGLRDRRWAGPTTSTALRSKAEATALRTQSIARAPKPQGLIRMSCPFPLMQGPVSTILGRFSGAVPAGPGGSSIWTNRRVDVIEEVWISRCAYVRRRLRRRNSRCGNSPTQNPLLVASPALLERYGRPAHTG